MYLRLTGILCLLLCSFQSHVQQPLDIGHPAPDFLATTMSGDTISLKTFEGDIILIDFWASWNVPSRKHNLSTKKIYEKYRAISLRKKRKFWVVQFSLDTRSDLLKVAISKDNLYWRTQICDYKGWHSKYADFFHITKLPSNYLVDTAGIIVAKDIWDEDLDAKLSTMMD